MKKLLLTVVLVIAVVAAVVFAAREPTIARWDRQIGDDPLIVIADSDSSQAYAGAMLLSQLKRDAYIKTMSEVTGYYQDTILVMTCGAGDLTQFGIDIDDCNSLDDNQGIIKVMMVNGNDILLVTGKTGFDVRRAANFLRYNKQAVKQIRTDEAYITGTTFSDIVVEQVG